MKQALFILLFFSFLSQENLHASKLEKGFEALSVYNYFKAKEIFTSITGKGPNAYASYGLAVIYMRSDNPFHHLDSAAAFVNRSFHAFLGKPERMSLSGFMIDSAGIRNLADSISLKSFQKVKKLNSIQACEHFLLTNYLGRKKYIYEAVYMRDELEYNQVMQLYRSDSTMEFIRTHPQSIFVKEAGILYERQLYDETTKSGQAPTYVRFLKKYPGNVMVNTAYEKLFAIYRQNNDTKGLAEFVQNYPKAPQNLEAWKLLFSLTVKNYSFAELKKFIDDYPKFPLKNSILKDLELNKLKLYPMQVGDYMGYTDNKGKLLIPAVYDEARDFSEGLAVVSRNDSVFYINKENTAAFGKIYQEATPFKNGIAAVRSAGKWHFINRQGQVISKNYDEINELSDLAYVVKAGEKFGALDQYGQSMLEPQFEKLGDFKNGFAYYVEAGKYGFAGKAGELYKAEFDWISDFDLNGLATAKVNGKYGIINTKGRRMVPIAYDQILKCEGPYFLLVDNNMYGFYHAAGCFQNLLMYDFQKDRPAEDYYTQGMFRLIRKNEQALADSNGRLLIPFGMVEDFGFPSGDRIKVEKRGKVGYADRKLNMAIPYKFQSGSDYKDSVAIVKLKNDFLLIDLDGKTLVTNSGGFTRVGNGYYLSGTGPYSLIRRDGSLVYEGVERISEPERGVIMVLLVSGEIKVLGD